MPTISIPNATGLPTTVNTLPDLVNGGLPVTPTGVATGAATSANQTSILGFVDGLETLVTAGNALLTAIGTKIDATNTSINSTLPASVDTVIQAVSTSRSTTAGTTASQLMAANTSRRGMVIQNQHATAKIYISGLATAVADNTSLLIGPGQYYESSTIHVGTGAISIISDTANTPVYAREF